MSRLVGIRIIEPFFGDLVNVGSFAEQPADYTVVTFRGKGFSILAKVLSSSCGPEEQLDKVL